MVLVVSQTHYAITGLGTATSISTAVGTISYSQTLISKEIRQVDGTVAPNSVVTISVKAAAKDRKSVV